MGRKFIIEEVEEESKFGCGSIVATIIIALVIGLCGGFKSCKEDKKPKAVESRTEQPQRLDEVKVQSPPYVPKSSHPSVSAPTSTTASKPQKEASVEPITEMILRWKSRLFPRPRPNKIIASSRRPIPKRPL